jgi:hypothetical protein
MAVKNAPEGDELVVLALFILSTAAYFSSTNGVMGSNDGSHYALIRSLVDNRSFTINSFTAYTGGIDYAVYKGNYFSDRAPGTAFAAAPFYAAGKALSGILPMPTYYAGFNAGNPALFAVMLFPVVAGGLSVCLLFLICRQLGAGTYPSAVTAMTLAFGTILWKYSAVLFSHSFSAFLLLSCVYLAVTLKDMKTQTVRSCALFFALGMMAIVEYVNAVLTGIILLYLLMNGRFTLPQMLSLRREYLAPIACLAVPLLALGAYDQHNFGNALMTSYNYSPNYPWAGSLALAFTTPMLDGVSGLLFGTSPQIESGLLFVTPALLLSVWGLAYLHRTRPSEAALLFALFAAHLLFYGRHKTWYGGGTADTRYMLTVTPALLAPLSMWMEGFLAKRRTQLERAFFEGLLWLLISVSVLNVAYDLATVDGPSARGWTFPALKAADLGKDFHGLFPHASRLPAYLGAVALALAAASLAFKRVPGADIPASDAGRYNPAVFGLAAAGLIAVALWGSQPAGSVSLGDWEYSVNGLSWGKAAPPFSADYQLMLVKGIVRVDGPVDPQRGVVLEVTAKDCVNEIFINDQLVATAGNCTPCMHCQGVRMDLARYLKPGGNMVGFGIVSVDNSTRFSVKAV